MGGARIIASAVIGFVLLPVVINIATGGSPPPWAIPAVLLLGAVATWLASAQYRADRRASPPGTFPTGFRDRALRKARSALDARLAYQPAAWAGIDLQDAPERVRPPDELTVVAEQAEAPDRVRTSFEAASRSLLLLGAPGGGKTTQLLSLAAGLMRSAQVKDADDPVPVVLDLASFRGGFHPARGARWPWRRSSTDDFGYGNRWLFRKLRREYGLGRQVVEEWLADHRLVLLLDGLDEVPPAHRRACLRWINQLQNRYRVPPMVVCSREVEYTEIGESLALQHAVRIAPLRRERVVAWLDEGGETLVHVRQAIDDDPSLWDLLDAPLWLDVLVAVSTSSPGGARGRSVPERRESLLNAYVEEAIRRGDQSSGYTRADVGRWLSRLAATHRPVVASRVGTGAVLRSDRLPADVAGAADAGFAVPVMAVVAVAGAGVMVWHAGVVITVAALIVGASAALLWALDEKGPAEDIPQVRPASLVRLSAAVAVIGIALSAAALGFAAGFSTLVGLLPPLPASIDWIWVGVNLLALAVIAGCVTAVVRSVTSYRSSEPLGQVLTMFPRRVANSVVAATVVIAAAFFVLGLAYLVLVTLPAPLVFTWACAFGFFTLGSVPGIGTTIASRGLGPLRPPRELSDAVNGVATALWLALLLAPSFGWLTEELAFQLLTVMIGAVFGLYVAALCCRLDLVLDTLTTLYLTCMGCLPWRLTRFLRYATRRDLLRSEGRDYRFRHQLFAEHFTDQDLAMPLEP
ncbi:NACHT domain-containing protein [Nonomuraea angiospora]|uniref:NACHT domain-containing protein n=1 Tax=Nonomuraea angiospora TaxID=46172 RepID=UPI00378FE106